MARCWPWPPPTAIDLNNPRDFSRLLWRKKSAAGDPWRRWIRTSASTGIRISLRSPGGVSQHFTDEEVRSLDIQMAGTRNGAISASAIPTSRVSTQKVFTVAVALEEGLSNAIEYLRLRRLQGGGRPGIRCVASKRTRPAEHDGGRGNHEILQRRHDADLAARPERPVSPLPGAVWLRQPSTGIDLPGEADTKNLLSTAWTAWAPRSWPPTPSARTINCTMIQMASAYCSMSTAAPTTSPTW